MERVAARLGWGQSLLFASGDFACNLYWQSITFYLLFFYTDTLGLSAAMAGLITMVASVWDGIAGLRMILGASAALIVAVGTQACIGAAPRIGYAIAAVGFGLVGTMLLIIVGGMGGDAKAAQAAPVRFSLKGALAAMSGNRAFACVNLGICGAVASMAVLTRAIPYYFKYEVGDAAAGSHALAMMSVAGVVAIPVWMACAARLGHRAQWQISAALAGLALVGLLVLRPTAALPAQILFIVYQAGGQGLFFGFWALIPDVVEHGGRPGAPRMDVLLFAIAALLQKVTMGVAVAIFGVSLSAAGYIARDVQPPHVLRALGLLAAALPLAALVIASAAMLRFPRSLGKARSS